VALGCRGVSCCGFPLSAIATWGTAGFFCLEVSTQPGTTETSFVLKPQAFAGNI
jgi:D-alanine-D-alanine ligase-like ATP-grasp enzyme